jgi:DNA-binding XRE family transcriptional regulator
LRQNTTEPRITITTVLRRRRQELDATQVELAQRVGCTQQSISLWELRGKVQGKKHRLALEAIFACAIADLEKENSADPKAGAAFATEVPPNSRRYDKE